VIAILSPWPSSVAAGSGTTVSQNRLVESLALVGVPSELVYTSRFATSPTQLDERRQLNARLGPELDGYHAVLGIDGEGWLWAARPRAVRYVAFCEAVLVEVLPFEAPHSAELLRAQAAWEGEAARAADVVVARSSFAAGRVAEAYGVPLERITVLPIPFDLDAWREGLPVLPKEPLVLAVGHAYPRKNYRRLLEAWPRVAAEHPSAGLIIVGTGPDSAALRRQAAALPSVSLLGHLPYANLLALYARAGVFCHPSLQENFGIAVVEGLACGASVVAHEHPAVLENIAGLPGVWSVDAREPPALAAALMEALAARTPWPDDRLHALRHKLDPERVGRQLRALLA
jgi:glycosyltransferase involved in cell wall biosynthesis